MSGGHWDYGYFTDSGYVSSILAIVNEVKHDLMGLSPVSELNNATPSQREAIEQATAYLERIVPEVEQLTARLEALLGYGSVYSQVVGALDKAYSDDIGLDSLEGVLRYALNEETHRLNLIALAKSKYTREGFGWSYLDAESYVSGWVQFESEFHQQILPKGAKLWVLYGDTSTYESKNCVASWQWSLDLP